MDIKGTEPSVSSLQMCLSLSLKMNILFQRLYVSLKIGRVELQVCKQTEENWKLRYNSTSTHYLGVAEIEFSRLLVLIQSCNRHAIPVNIDKPSDVNICHANDSYKVFRKHVRKKALVGGYLIPLLCFQKPCSKETQFPTVHIPNKLKKHWVKQTIK